MIPTQAYCDPDKPEEAALWAVVGIEETPGVPMIVPESALRGLSKQLHDAGFRHHPELQTKKAIIVGAPEQEGVSWMGVGEVKWVPIDHVDSPEVLAAVAAEQQELLIDDDLDQASGAQLMALAQKLQERGVIRAPEAPTAADAGDHAVASDIGGD
ncbi:hypothetical protein CH298_13465 [Rhodococcoides fascians]|uniref:phage gene 29 protein family protein n=1 Tax=Rhodococcoides fascians TaxID=1828 RepID=UPI000B9AEE35|nr:DUF2744 domain-containing protein [Rhodococcus fascians]OZE89985.1 hypothetical protein CH303_13345 [Rhodococcus fascians]OZF18292.1 hypothetical protein CH298_13465 [Rhodococcus fascians]OZF21743.1 hypothetical protein CH297_13360 [Rhodococcus fascians]OZF67368.1 hypothetical protein CH308_13260 [Rhodococcus fascians]OZF70558.1 hypothetical protein CH307_13455 [Rhodococcus fascians]